MKVLYITAQIPWGKGETFILEEMIEVKRQGLNLLIIPRNPSKEIFHNQAKKLLDNATWFPLITPKMVIVFLKFLLTRINIWKILGFLIIYSRNLPIFIKNLIVFPKAIFIIELIREQNVDHIHAHWGSTTSTMAYIISKLSGIPWSFTLHRWDIKENNMLEEKIKYAKFVRCISEDGERELLQIIKNKFKSKIKVIHMGVEIYQNDYNLQYSKKNNKKKLFKIVVPANLIEKKGHKYLVEAFSILVNKENIKNFECIFYGDGPLRRNLEKLIKDKFLIKYLKMTGIIMHKKLMKIYKNHEVDIVILPSIIIKNGEREGIPVALMEAMAYSIPVISTNTGGIPELLSGKAGVIVEKKNPKQLAIAIKKFIKNRDFREKIGRQGHERVCKEFNIQKKTEKLLELFKYYSLY